MVKFICGSSVKGELAPGRYFTAVNIANRRVSPTQFVMRDMDVIQTNGERRVVAGIRVAALPGRDRDRGRLRRRRAAPQA